MIVSLLVNTIINSLFFLALYFQIGKVPDLIAVFLLEGEIRADLVYRQFVHNIGRLTFIFCIQFSICASLDTVLEVPLQAPVMKRELASKMYSPTSYFFGRFLSHVLKIMLIPIITILLLFWNL